VRVSQAYSTLIALILALSREGRGERIKVKRVNAFVLIKGGEHWTFRRHYEPGKASGAISPIEYRKK
jgi:hypothetical protein